MSYNLSFADNVTNIYQVIYYVNEGADSIPSMIALFLIWAALFAVYQYEGTGKALTVSSFVSTIIAAFMWLAGFFAWYVATVPLIMMIAGMILMKIGD